MSSAGLSARIVVSIPVDNPGTNRRCANNPWHCGCARDPRPCASNWHGALPYSATVCAVPFMNSRRLYGWLIAPFLVAITSGCATTAEPLPEPTAVRAGFDPASAVGTWAPGAPSLITELPDPSTVLASSVRDEEPVVVVSANLRVGMPQDEVISYYDDLFTNAKFTGSDERGARMYTRSLSAGTTERIDEVITLVTVADGTSTLVSLSGRLAPDEDGLG